MKSNTEKGKDFQLQAQKAVSNLLGINFDMEVGIPIGSPAKDHDFDLASKDLKYVGEVKAYTWTLSGNNPSAKISNLREAVQYLNELPLVTNKFIIMLRNTHSRKKETLAEYFVRLNKNILSGIVVLELSEDGNTIRPVHGQLKTI